MVQYMPFCGLNHIRSAAYQPHNHLSQYKGVLKPSHTDLVTWPSQVFACIIILSCKSLCILCTCLVKIIVKSLLLESRQTRHLKTTSVLRTLYRQRETKRLTSHAAEQVHETIHNDTPSWEKKGTGDGRIEIIRNG